jgi:hypothetical protein
MNTTFSRFTKAGATVALLFFCNISPAQNEKPNRSKAVEALKALEQKTGKTADELLPAIEIYASMIEILADDLESGTVKKKELIDLKVITKNLLEATKQDSSMDASTKLVALRMLNDGNSEKLKEWLRKGIAEYYVSILEEPDQAASTYRQAVDKAAEIDPKLKAELGKLLNQKTPNKAEQGNR